MRSLAERLPITRTVVSVLLLAAALFGLATVLDLGDGGSEPDGDVSAGTVPPTGARSEAVDSPPPDVLSVPGGEGPPVDDQSPDEGDVAPGAEAGADNNSGGSDPADGAESNDSPTTTIGTGPDTSAGGGPTSTTAPAPTTTTTTTTGPGSSGDRGRFTPSYGFSPGGWFPDEPTAQLGSDLDRMVEAGATWLRIDFDWSEIEGTRGTFHWHRTDRVVDAAARRGLKVLGLVGETPRWARPQGLNSHAPPIDPAHYARFAAAAVERYENRGVEAWELWNEPNLALFWSPRPDAGAYADLVVPTVAAMRSVDPDAVIISGGLAPAADESDGSGISPLTFTAQMLDAGADGFDGFAIHPYSYPARPIDASTAAWNPFHNLPLLRDLLRDKGQGGKPIWLTEYGAPTGTSSRAVSEAEQAAQITEALAAVGDWPWTGPMFLYSHRDERINPADFQANFGLMSHDGTPKQAWRDLLAVTGR